MTHIRCDQCGSMVECPIPAWQQQIRELEAEIERLQAENQRLRQRQGVANGNSASCSPAEMISQRRIRS